MSKFYITTSIAYVNATPHIGHALESVQADVLARWHRQQGDEVFFLTGTDEHGAKIARTASAFNKTPRELVDEYAEQFIKLKDALNLSWVDHGNFIRTSDEKKHWPVVQELWKRLADAGVIYKKQYEGLYCVGHEAFVTNKDLKDGVCEIHKKKPEVIQEENWFFKLSQYSQEIESKIRNNELRIVPETRKNEILSLFEEGLEDVSFSRPRKDISWGIPVPGDDTQTIYVWADALSNYISGYGGISEWKAHPADVHVIGKDILRFHAAIWPAMLIAANLPLPKNIFVHGFITVNGEKISKSLGNVVDPFELVKQYGVDAVRYYLLREIPSFEDGDFSHEKFKERYNGDLANGLGNLVSRVATLGEKLGAFDTHQFQTSIESIEVSEKYVQLIKDFKFHETLEEIFKDVHIVDKKINDEKPWAKDRVVQIGAIFVYSVFIIRIARKLAPFLPETAEKIQRNFSIKDGILTIKKSEALFPRL